MKVVHVVAGLSPLDGGPSHTLPELWRALLRVGVEVDALTTTAAGEESPSGGCISAFPRVFPRSFKHSPALGEALGQKLQQADLCHNHGCWLSPNWAAGWAARVNRKPLIISPLGHLDAWSRERWALAKIAIRILIEGKNWDYASAFIAKSDAEASELRQLGLGDKVRVIPNGISPQDGKGNHAAFRAQFPPLEGKRILLFLSRIHSKKGVLKLVQAWRELAPQYPDWKFVIAGDTSGSYGGLVVEAVEHMDAKIRPILTGELSGPAKAGALSAADLFVLPSLSENFGQAILEALAAGVPVIATRQCPWPGLETHGCGWWIESANLAATMREAMALEKSALTEMGSKGCAWVLRDYSWDVVAGKMKGLYEELRMAN